MTGSILPVWTLSYRNYRFYGVIITMNSFEKKLYLTGIVPVIKISDESRAVALAHALRAGGLRVVEVTFRTPAAADAIFAMREACPDMLIGAGTVLTDESLRLAHSAGAQFIVSPGLDPSIVESALALGLPMLPGCMTPTELSRAMSMGLSLVKLFPAEVAGGVGFIRAVAAPYSSLRFMPTGGISMNNAADYLSLPCVLCCGASFIASDRQISEGRFDEIEQNARLAAELNVKVRISAATDTRTEET